MKALQLLWRLRATCCLRQTTLPSTLPCPALPSPALLDQSNVANTFAKCTREDNGGDALSSEAHPGAEQGEECAPQSAVLLAVNKRRLFMFINP